MGSGHNQACDTGLSLGLMSFSNTSNKKDEKSSPVSLKFDHVLPCLSLGPADQMSTSPGSSSVGGCHGEEAEVDRRLSDEEEEASPRKKLRLTKDQAAVLEDSFREHSTLNPTQKQALARQLNLRPRQVEVWFQNRRARTKLKQTEMDCELLKKSCKALTEENKRLQKELQELKALKLAAPGYMQIPARPLSMCPSCGRLMNATSPVSDDHRYASSAGTPSFFSMNATKPTQLFTHSSAAC